VAAALAEEGKLLLQQKQYQQASSLFASCVELDKGNAECNLGLGTSWTRLGSPEKAAPYYREFLRLDPGHALAKEVRAALQRSGSR
jgi:Flp pilus assembly protein TadD